jgi:methanogenic corrinoid protein MtbC1
MHPHESPAAEDRGLSRLPVGGGIWAQVGGQHGFRLAGLIMAGEIFSQVMELLQPVFERQISEQASGHILLGTVRGDIHDLGKNIVNMLLSCHRFAIRDLGVDVSPDLFGRQVTLMQPHIVGLSGLLTSAYDAMRKTVTLLRAQGYRAPIIIGGGQISEEVRQYVGADYWTTDGATGIQLCKRLIATDAVSNS